jgi:hypothetical protein
MLVDGGISAIWAGQFVFTMRFRKIEGRPFFSKSTFLKRICRKIYIPAAKIISFPAKLMLLGVWVFSLKVSQRRSLVYRFLQN